MRASLHLSWKVLGLRPSIHAVSTTGNKVLVRYTISPNLPLPARTALTVVQAALKVKRKIAEQLLHDGAVSCQGRMVTQPHWCFNVGDEVAIDYAPQPIKQKRAKAKLDARFEVIYDDEYVIVVNKPAALLTVPTPKRERNTLQSQVRKWLEKQPGAGQAICVQRLDRGVSGVLVFGKSYEAADRLRSQFAARKPERKYVAIVQGTLKQPTGTFKTYLATDDSLNRYSSSDPEKGELAITHYRVKEVWKDTTCVEVRLETGRRNQIRVHFAETGHPLLGDPRYRPEQAEHPLWPFKRIALHAETLGITHPESGEVLQFTAPWPQEFRDFRRRSVPRS
ncbi:RluA family pseudouridine synthase [Aureliella helgolandensis]|nr:RluA family pseudouridine synthase [Aureliella helgolandensis]